MLRLVPALIAATLLAAPALAQPAPPPNPGQEGPTVSVTGEGTVHATPDLAVLHAAVVTDAADPSAALSQNSAAMRATVAAFKAAGVAERDIATSGFTVEPLFGDDPTRPQSEPRKITGYEVRNEVTVKVRDLGRLGATMQAAVAAGANAARGLSFDIAEPGRLLDEARRQAVDDARHRATLYADALGLRLGPLVRLSDRGTSMPRPVPMYRTLSVAAAPVPVSPGERDVSASVTAVWRLQPK